MKKYRSMAAMILIIALAATMLTGCAKKAANDYAESPAAAATESYKATEDYGYYMEEVAEEAVWEDETEPVYTDNTAGTGEEIPDQQSNESKLVYTAFVSIETITYDETLQKIRQMTDQFGGYFENSDTSNYGSYRYASYTIRIPSENYRSFVSAANEMQMVVAFNESVENVTSDYYDTQSRLDSAKKELEGYEELYAEATDIEDMLVIKGYINDVQYRIDWLSGELRNYDSLVGYSTVNVSVSEVAKLRGQDAPAIGFGARLGSAFRNGWENFTNGLENFAIGFAENFMGWIIFLAIVAVVVIIIVRSAKKNKMKKDALMQARMQNMTIAAQMQPPMGQPMNMGPQGRAPQNMPPAAPDEQEMK